MMNTVKKKNIETNAELKTISDYAIILEELNGYSIEDSRRLAAESKGEPLFERLLERNRELFKTGEIILFG